MAFPLALLALSGCSDDASDDAALDGQGGSCTVEDRGDGTAVIRCADGSEFTVSNGTSGADGKDGKDGNDGNDGKDAQEPPCALTENDDGTHTLTCGNQSVVIGAPCEAGFPGDVIVTDESDVEAASHLMLFQVSSCTWIRGQVMISKYPGEELPKALERIEKVDGNVIVTQNEELVEVGFPVLKTVDGIFAFMGNPKLVATSLPALESVGESLMWAANEELASVGELPKLTEVGGDLGWGSNPNLEHTPDVPELASVGGYLGWDLNESLVSIGAFPKLTTVGGTLEWRRSKSLENMGSFDALESVGDLSIRDTASLEAIVEFPKLETVAKDLTIRQNAALTDIGGLGSLTMVGGDFTVQDNPELSTCDVEDLISLIQDADGIGGTTTTTGNDNSCIVL